MLKAFPRILLAAWIGCVCPMLCAAGVACCDDGPRCCGTDHAERASDADHGVGSETVPPRAPVQPRDPCFCTGTALAGTRIVVPSAQLADVALDGAPLPAMQAGPGDATLPRFAALPQPPRLAGQSPLLI